jgi:uncharacterized protein YjbJ (UPF0337 family)
MGVVASRQAVLGTLRRPFRFREAAHQAEIAGNTSKLHGGKAYGTRRRGAAARVTSSARSTSEMSAALASALRVYLVECEGGILQQNLGPVTAPASAKGKIEMNSEQFEGKWKQIQGQIRQKWGHLTDNDMQVIAGKRDVLIGRVEERYGLAKEKATAEVDGFLKSLQAQPEHNAQDSTERERNDRTKTHTVGSR